MSDERFPLLGRIDGVAGGMVCLRGTGIIASCLVERFTAGESLASIAKDYGKPVDAVIEAVRCVLAASAGRDGVRVTTERRMELLVPLEGKATP